jgi:hypothetical protein
MNSIVLGQYNAQHWVWVGGIMGPEASYTVGSWV